MTKSKREVENLKTQHNDSIEWGQAEGFSNYLISTDGQVYSLKRDKLIEPANKNGIKGSYLVVTIYNDKGQKKYMLVHRLVFMAHK